MNPVQSPPTPTFLSEIFPLTISQPNLTCFRLTPEITREEGNRLSFHLSRNLPRMVLIWHQGYFYALGMPKIPMPSPEKWQVILEYVQNRLKDFGERYWSFQWVRQPQATPLILAQLAVQVLNKTRFDNPLVLLEKGVEVRREVDFWQETIELKGKLQPALTLTVRSSILYRGNLAEFYENHPYRQNPKQLLIGLNVRSIESGGYGTVTEIVGTVGEHREKLIENATGAISKQELQNAPDEQPLVAVQFGKDPKKYHYAIAALRPCVTDETARLFEVEYGKLLKATKIPDKQRTDLLTYYKKRAGEALATYGFQLSRSINSQDYNTIFWQPPQPLESTPLLFGNGVRSVQGKILTGLSKGGVYRRQRKYQDASISIGIAVLNLCELNADKFMEEVRKRLKSYKFESEIVGLKQLSVNNLSGAEARATVERAADELMVSEPDIVLTFLPQSDRHDDNKDGGSLYYWVYSRLLRRQKASQVIYADTLSRVDQWKNILNQVIPGILAKLGNLPFVLAEPLNIADYFIGLDISRFAKKKGSGSVNACAIVRIYGQKGEFIRYHLEDKPIEGEAIPPEFLETLLPASELRGKTVLIYRDGYFCGGEDKHLRDWAKAICSKFILVECRKSGVPRLYNLNQKVVKAPDKGLALRLSSREAVLVTTKVSPTVGLARPLRLTVLEQEDPVAIEDLLDTTLKLTLLHHGALHTPRLPMPLYGSDRMAYLRLKGIYPSSMLEGDRQFWL